MRLSDWKPYQVTHTERRPALEAQKTLFNLVPCNRGLEVALTGFAEKATDVAAFAKNAGPQCVDRRTHRHYQSMAQNLKRTLVFNNGLSPLGLLRSCLDYALNDKTKLTGVFEAVAVGFRVSGARELLGRVEAVNDFRNTYVAHHDKDLTNSQVAADALKRWVQCLADIHTFA